MRTIVLSVLFLVPTACAPTKAAPDSSGDDDYAAHKVRYKQWDDGTVFPAGTVLVPREDFFEWPAGGWSMSSSHYDTIVINSDGITSGPVDLTLTSDLTIAWW